MREDIPYIEKERGAKHGARTEEAQSKYGTCFHMPLTQVPRESQHEHITEASGETEDHDSRHRNDERAARQHRAFRS
ncbi:protein of unknown function (plasmid) [Caballeronia sp. S22]